MQNQNIQSHVFPNGFRLIHERPNNTLGICSIHIFLDFGSAHETDEYRGAAHFIEHMCFKGTKRFPEPTDIYEKYDKIGAYINAFTEKRYTVYICNSTDPYLENCICLFADMMLNSTFKPAEFKKEQHVVMEENIIESDDSAKILEKETGTVLYKGSSYEYPIDTMDYHKNSKFSYKNIVKMHRLFYRPERMILSVVSNVPFKKIVKMLALSPYIKPVAKYAVERPSKESIGTELRKHSLYYQDIAQTEIIYSFHNKPNSNTTHLNVSFRACDQYSTDRYTLNMLKYILSGSFGSKLAILFREKHGITYNSFCSTTHYEHAGDITICIKVDKNKVLKNGKAPGVLPLLIGLLNELLKKGVSREELETSKKNMRGKQILELESTETQCQYNGRELLLYSDVSKIVPLKRVYDVHYSPITLKNIHDVIKQYIKKEGMVVCMVGSDLPSRQLVNAECQRLL